MNAIVDRVVEIVRVFVFAYATDDAVRLVVLLAIAALGGLLLSVRIAEPSGRPAPAALR